MKKTILADVASLTQNPDMRNPSQSSLHPISNTTTQNNLITPDDNAAHILIVDDDQRIRSLLSRYLNENGFRVAQARDAQEARKRMKSLEYDLLILDIMMPGEDGINFCSHIRKNNINTPVLMLTALGETNDRINGLSVGADDFLAKPFDPRELVLRIKNLLRRHEASSTSPTERVSFGPFTFSVNHKQLRSGNTIIRLTEVEQDIMALLCSKGGQVVVRHELLNHATSKGERTVDVQINRLRRKIEADPKKPVWLQTVRGIGYKLNLE